MNPDPPTEAGPPPGPERAARPGSTGWASAVIAVAVGALVLFNAESMRSWTAQQPPDPVSLAARHVAETWWEVASRLGLTAPRDAVVGLWRGVLAARWPPALQPGRQARPGDQR